MNQIQYTGSAVIIIEIHLRLTDELASCMSRDCTRDRNQHVRVKLNLSICRRTI